VAYIGEHVLRRWKRVILELFKVSALLLIGKAIERRAREIARRCCVEVMQHEASLVLASEGWPARKCNAACLPLNFLVNARFLFFKFETRP
jgi:hypothetical protein